jgi:hypothetical protein
MPRPAPASPLAPPIASISIEGPSALRGCAVAITLSTPPIQVVHTESRIRRKCSGWPCAEPLLARCRTSPTVAERA